MKNKVNFKAVDLEKMEKQLRVHLINSLGGFKSVALVGTSDSQGNTNLSVFSSFFHIGVATFDWSDLFVLLRCK